MMRAAGLILVVAGVGGLAYLAARLIAGKPYRYESSGAFSESGEDFG